jgi:hypothetical protein
VYVQLQGKCKDNRLGDGNLDVETVLAMCGYRVGVNVMVRVVSGRCRVDVNVSCGWPSGLRRQVKERAAG